MMKFFSDFYALLISVILMLLFTTCSFGDNTGKMRREKVSIGKGTYVFVYHTSSCNEGKTYFTCWDDKISYKKQKYDVFDYCFSDDDLQMLTEISRRNIKEYEENALIICEDSADINYYKGYLNVLDSGKCNHTTQYAMKNSKIIRLSQAFNPVLNR